MHIKQYGSGAASVIAYYHDVSVSASATATATGSTKAEVAASLTESLKQAIAVALLKAFASALIQDGLITPETIEAIKNDPAFAKALTSAVDELITLNATYSANVGPFPQAMPMV